MEAYILIETNTGSARSVMIGLEQINTSICRILSIEAVTGPYDVILKINTDELKYIGSFINDYIGTIEGIRKTITCMVTELGPF